MYFGKYISSTTVAKLCTKCKRSLTSHLRPDHLQLLAGQLDGNLLNFARGTDDLLNDLDSARLRHQSVHHLRRLQLNDLWLLLLLRWLLLLLLLTAGCRRGCCRGSSHRR